MWQQLRGKEMQEKDSQEKEQRGKDFHPESDSKPAAVAETH
jgi:hypothetical protein